MSTRSPRSSAFGRGFREALGAAAWTAPLLAPLGVLQALLVAAPWLSSIEAMRQDVLLSSSADWRTREALETALSVLHGLPGAAAIAVVLTAGWLVALRLRGPLRSTPPWSLHETSHRAHALRLLAGLAGAAGCLVVRPTGTRLDLLVDSITSLRPTGAASLALLAASQVLALAAVGAILGATLALARAALDPARRAGALAALVAIVALTAGTQAASRAWIAERFDAGRSLAQAIGSSEPPRPIVLLVLARDRAFILPMRDGVAGVRFSREAAERAQLLLARRRGWTTLAVPLEAYAIGERLVAMDPEGARARALDGLLRLAQPATGHALLVALGSAAPSAETRRVVGAIQSAPSLHAGPQALLLMAQAHAQAGDRTSAERMLARIRAGSEALLIASRVGAPVVLNAFVSGRVSGTVIVDGRPHRGRVGLVATRDLFTLPDESDVPITWLLRLVAAGETDESGRFELGGLPQGEMALVLLVPTTRDDALAAATPLPRIELGPSQPTVELGRVDVAITGTPVRGKKG